MPAGFEWTGYAKMRGKLDRLINPDPTELLNRMVDVAFEDNRRKIMGGFQGDGLSMPPTIYRLSLGSAASHLGGNLRSRARAGGKVYDREGTVASYSLAPKILPSDSLRTWQYRQMSGPPLAPRGMASRIITNFGAMQMPVKVGQWRWMIVVGWKDIWSRGTKRRSPELFMRYHFNGSGKLPRRDPRGLLPWGQKEIQSSIRVWVKAQIEAQRVYFQSIRHTA